MFDNFIHFIIKHIFSIIFFLKSYTIVEMDVSAKIMIFMSLFAVVSDPDQQICKVDQY